MNGMAILTAREYDIPVVWSVENNQMHGVTWHGSKLVSGGNPMESIVYKKPLHIADIARAMGLAVWQVKRPGEIQDALKAALESGRPSVIDVWVDKSVTPPLADRAKTVAGFKGT